MDISLEKSSLLKIIQNTQRAISNKSSLPVLNGIYLESSNNIISAYSTDLEISIKDKAECLTRNEGKVVVYGNLLVDLVKNLDDGKIDLFFNDKENKLNIKTAKSKFSLNTLPVEDFPPFPDVNQKNVIKIKNNDLLGAIRQVVISSSRDETRPVLSGVLFEIGEESIKVVATDSYRLSLKEIISKQEQNSSSLIIPRRAVEELNKIISKDTVSRMIYSDNQVSFESEGTVFVSRLIGGQYPNYQQLFPKEFQVEATIKRDELLQSAKRMALLSPTTPIVLQISEGKIVTSNKSADVGSGQEEISVSGKTKEMEVAFNCRYLIDGLNAINEENIILQLVDSFQPGLIKSVEDKNYLYLIMPIRLS